MSDENPASSEDGARNRQDSFQLIINTIRDGIVAIDRESIIRVFNSAAEDIFGYAAAEAIGHNVTLLIPEETHPVHDNYVRNADLHAPKIIDEGRDLAGRRKDGTIFPMELTVSSAMLRDEPVYVAVCRDITERKKSLEELRAKTDILELLYLISDKANRAVTGSEAMASSVRDVCVHTGWPVGHIYLRDDAQSDRVKSSQIWYFSDAKKFRTFQEASQNAHYGWAEGMPGRVLSSAKAEWISDLQNDPRFRRGEAAREVGLKTGFAVPVLARNEVIAVLEFYSCDAREQDDTLLDALTNVGTQLGRVVERRRAAKALKEKEKALQAHVTTLSETQEQLEEKGRELAASRDRLEDEVANRTEELAEALEQEQEYNALQREFVGMASHELRTPITIIDGEMRRIMKRAETIGPDEIAERGKVVRGAVGRMQGLIDSTLSSARLEAGKIELNLAACDIGEVINEVCGRQQEIAPNNEIKFDGTALPDEIHGDPQLLDQVFTNLLSNAVKYSGSNPKIEVRGYADRSDVVFTVRDYGLGIPEDELPRMFQRFFRARTSTGISGTGIGLTVVQQFVERHGGSVGVESVEGEGSTFTVRLPIDGPPQKLGAGVKLVSPSAVP
jgi:PAS domain S-box-containing protein